MRSSGHVSTRPSLVVLLAFAVQVSSSFTFLSHVIVPGTALFSSPTNTLGDEKSPSDEWLERAAQLRREAEQLEAKLGPRKEQASGQALPVARYKDVMDSIWMLSYRFSDEPEPKDDEVKKRTFYTGKIVVRFRADGYTDVVSKVGSVGESSVDFVKVWGWDVETSTEDSKDYLLFSADVKLPRAKTVQRFYFQARQESDRDGFVNLQGGTITIKQDIVEANQTPRFWGLFSPRGILAQFRYVGDFVAKPSS